MNSFPLEELKDRFIEEPKPTVNDVYREYPPRKSPYPDSTLLTVTFDTPMKAKDIRALLNKKVIGVETFAVGDEVELSTASLVFSTKSYED